MQENKTTVEPIVDFGAKHPHFKIVKGSAENKRKKGGWRILKFLKLFFGKYAKACLGFIVSVFVTGSALIWGPEGFRVAMYILASIAGMLVVIAILVGASFVLYEFWQNLRDLWNKSKNV